MKSAAILNDNQMLSQFNTEKMMMAQRVTSGAEHIYESSSKDNSVNDMIFNDLASRVY